MKQPVPMTQLPEHNIFRKGDVFVLFGELFGRGYANGLVNEARNAGMTIVGITVGRREADGTLRPLNDEELAASEKGLVSLMRDELRNGRVALGVVPVKGPGIELVLDDSTMHTGTDVGGQDLFVIHDVYLLQVANELYASGAEAVSLNGHRLVSGSAITCSTRLIKVNDVAISNPFVFLAIGNKDNLVSALNIRDGFLDFLRRLEFKVKLTPKDEIVIPPVAIAPTYEYSQAVTKEAGR